jgi:hypothetical protein
MTLFLPSVNPTLIWSSVNPQVPWESLPLKLLISDLERNLKYLQIFFSESFKNVLMPYKTRRIYIQCVYFCLKSKKFSLFRQSFVVKSYQMWRKNLSPNRLTKRITERVNSETISTTRNKCFYTNAFTA